MSVPIYVPSTRQNDPPKHTAAATQRKQEVTPQNEASLLHPLVKIEALHRCTRRNCKICRRFILNNNFYCCDRCNLHNFPLLDVEWPYHGLGGKNMEGEGTGLDWHRVGRDRGDRGGAAPD